MRAIRVGIIAAFPAELKPLVREWRRRTLARGDVIWRSRMDSGKRQAELAAVAAGMGRESATRACRILDSFLGEADLVVSVGFAGALSCDLRAGAAYPIARVVDGVTGEWFSSFMPAGEASNPAYSLVTMDHVVKRQVKLSLRGQYSAGMVDMEAAAVARAAKDRGSKFCCIKAVSDSIDEDLPEFHLFQNQDGKFEGLRLGIHLALRPRYWPALARMGKNSRVGAQALASAVKKLVNDANEDITIGSGA